MLGILLGAILLGAIITMMEDETPDWFDLAVCAGVSVLAAFGLRTIFTPEWALLSLAINAVLVGVTISIVCSMSFKRAMIASGIYFVVQIVLTVGLMLLLRSNG